jgi:hypothetical protein
MRNLKCFIFSTFVNGFPLFRLLNSFDESLRRGIFDEYPFSICQVTERLARHPRNVLLHLFYLVGDLRRCWF